MRYDPAIPLHGDPCDRTQADTETDEERLVREQVERGIQVDQLVEDLREAKDELNWTWTRSSTERQERIGELVDRLASLERTAQSLAAQQNVRRVA